jgi:hypothetical protein
MKFFRGVIIAIPISIVLWAFLIVAILQLFSCWRTA